MISAFGVTHTISKGVPRKIRLLLPKPSDSMADRMKVNYAQKRVKANMIGRDVRNMTNTLKGAPDDLQRESLPRYIESAKAQGARAKAVARASTTSVNNINRRRKRVLP